MPRVSDIMAYLAELAPPSLAEEWDNVGLLFGDAQHSISSVMTCLTLTPEVAAEAIARNAGLVVAHHPILFRAVKRLTADTSEGRMLLDLAAAQVAIYSPHTGYDTALAGINQQLAELFDLSDIGALRPPKPPAGMAPASNPGSGRCGNLRLPQTLGEWMAQVKLHLGISQLQFVGDPQRVIRRVGIACGSAAEFLPDARRQQCDGLLTGEARFHACLEAEAMGIALVLAGHYATERPGMEHLAGLLAERFPDLTVWASRTERDPLEWA